MTPILGILASGMSGNLWSPGKDFDSIATAVGTGSSATVTFSSIPATYRHLQIRVFGLSTGGQLMFRANGTTTGYPYSHYLNGSGTAASAGSSQASGAQIPVANVTTGFSTTYPTVAVIDVLDYADTNKFKTVRSLGGNDTNGGGNVFLMSGFFQSTSAINSVTLFTDANFATTTQIALYGVK